jgi:hypothetical protein
MKTLLVSLLSVRMAGQRFSGGLLITILFALNLFQPPGAVGQTPIYLWAASGNSTAAYLAESIGVDAMGNSYVAGWFESTNVTFGNVTLINSATNASTDIFVVKYDPAGNVVWARSAGGKGYDYAYGIAVDRAGNSYVTGDCVTPATFGSITVTNSGMYLAKYDPNGTVLWVKQGQDSGSAVALDSGGNVYVTGYFYEQTAMFDNLTVVNTTSGFGGFLVKYNSSGTALWAASLQGATPQGLASDAAGNTFVTGNFGSQAIFDTITLNNHDTSGFSDCFTAAYDSNGQVLWAVSAGGSMGDTGEAVATDGHGNCYLAGAFDSPTITLGGTTLTNHGDESIFVVDYGSGGSVLWARSEVGPGYGYDTPHGITMNGEGQVVVTGGLGAVTTFGSVTLTNGGIFLVAYDTSGNVLWGKSSGGANSSGIAADNLGNVFLSGLLSANTKLDNITLTVSANNSGDDSLAAKVGFPPLGVARVNAQLFFSWTKNAAGFALQSATNLPPGTNWTTLTNLPAVVGNNNVISNTLAGGKKFYRLKHP